MSELNRIEEIYLFLIRSKDAPERVVMAAYDDSWAIFIASSAEKAEEMEKMAQAVADDNNCEVIKARFSSREDLRTIIPSHFN